jgi:hypothetical protein
MESDNILINKLSIYDLINEYARFADRRQPEKQVELFTSDAVIEIFMEEPGINDPVQEFKGAAALLKGFSGLCKYDITSHFNGQSTIHKMELLRGGKPIVSRITYRLRRGNGYL